MHIPTHIPENRGFALLVAIIFTAVVLSVSLALLNVSYKQILLTSTARQSQYAFYNADSALECALELDQKGPSGSSVFDYTAEPAGTNLSPIQCEGQTFNYTASAQGSSPRTTTFSIPCAGGSTNASVVVTKTSSGGTNMYSNGFNNCNTNDPYGVERGIKANY